MSLRGANLAGGDNYYAQWPAGGLGPVSGTNYLFVSTQDIDYLLSKGANCVRLLFGWESMQPTPLAAIPGTGNYGTYFSKFKAVVDYATSKGLSVIIDIHGGDATKTGAAYYGVKVGQTYAGVSVETLLVDLWSKLANIFKGNSLVQFGICNEPNGLPTLTWFACAQKVINGIRATGATNRIVMPGNGYTNASTWTSSWYDATGKSNAYGWANAAGTGVPLTDPAKNLAVQVHLYADSDGGGGTTDVVSPSVLVDRLKVTVDWARANGVQVFVAEVGLAASAPNATLAWSNFLAYCNTNAVIIQGFCWWAYGPPSWWGGYQFSLCPSSSYTADSAQMKLIAPSLAQSVPTTVDVAALQATITQQAAQIAANLVVIAKLNADLAAEIALADANAAKAAKYFDALKNVQAWLTSVGVS